MEMIVTFPGGKRVDATFDGLTVHTDQPVSGGGLGSAAAPYDLFLASIATCAGIFALGFCQSRGLDPSQIRLSQRVRFDPETHLAAQVDLDLEVDPAFPEKYLPALVRVIDQCKVKRTLAAPPTFAVNVKHSESKEN